MAIAYDNSAESAGSSTAHSFSYTTSGSNRILIAGIHDSDNNHSVTTITYGGVSLSEVQNQTGSPNSEELSLWYLINPASGSNTFVCNTSDGTRITLASYTGANQSSQPDSSAKTSSSLSTTLATTTTVVETDTWLVGIAGNANNLSGLTISAGSGTTIRQEFSSAGDGAFAIADSNGTVSTGSQSLNFSVSSVRQWTGAVLSIKAEPDFTPHSMWF